MPETVPCFTIRRSESKYSTCDTFLFKVFYPFTWELGLKELYKYTCVYTALYVSACRLDAVECSARRVMAYWCGEPVRCSANSSERLC